jgi:hypothetical protein
MLQVEAAADEAQSADSVMKPPQPITISLVRPAALPVDVTLMQWTHVTSLCTIVQHGLSLSVTLPSSAVARPGSVGKPLKRVTSWDRLQVPSFDQPPRLLHALQLFWLEHWLTRRYRLFC